MRMHPNAEIVRLRRRVSELEREKQEVEGFAAVAAHELLTPVVLIDACAVSISEQLDLGERDAELRRDLEMLRRGCLHSRLLVESLLHSAYGDRPLERDRVELQALVAECLALLEPELRARDAQVRVGPLPAVDAEAPLIGSVFTNLLANALKYGPRWKATVRVGAQREPAAWRFSVHSDGLPIPREDCEWIFEPRRRGRGERRARGGGLGLAICRGIVERHGGEIGVAAVDGGNTFSFTLPV